MAATGEQRTLVGHDRVLATGFLIGVMDLEYAQGID